MGLAQPELAAVAGVGQHFRIRPDRILAVMRALGLKVQIEPRTSPLRTGSMIKSWPSVGMASPQGLLRIDGVRRPGVRP